MEQGEIHTLILGVADHMAAAHIRKLVEEHPRLDLIGVADNAVKTLHMATEDKPAVVLLADSSPGLRGREVLAAIAEASPNTLVIITTPGDPKALMGQPGVAESVPEHDTEAIVAALDSLASFLDNPVTDDGPDRRHRLDRRLQQDWSQVFAERRVSTRRV